MRGYSRKPTDRPSPSWQEAHASDLSLPARASPSIAAAGTAAAIASVANRSKAQLKSALISRYLILGWKQLRDEVDRHTHEAAYHGAINADVLQIAADGVLDALGQRSRVPAPHL